MGMLYRKYVWDKVNRKPLRDLHTGEAVRSGPW